MNNTPQPTPLGEPAPTVLWLIRHAEVEASYQKVFGGRIDMDLSPEGRKQAQSLGQYLRKRHFEAVYASPMRRVQETIRSLECDGLPRARIIPDLREVDFGDWTGLSWAEVHTKFGISAYEWLHQLERGGIRNGESSATLRARVGPCLKQLLEDHRGRRVAVVCHGGVIRMALSILLDVPLPAMCMVEVDYASISQVAWEPGRARVELLNFTPWRDLA